jgi:hypothetical protein
MAALQLGVNLLVLYENYYIVVSEFELLWQIRWPLGASGALREILAIVTDEFAFGYSGIGHLGTGHLHIFWIGKWNNQKGKRNRTKQFSNKE